MSEGASKEAVEPNGSTSGSRMEEDALEDGRESWKRPHGPNEAEPRVLEWRGEVTDGAMKEAID